MCAMSTTRGRGRPRLAVEKFCEGFTRDDAIARFRWIVVVDDSQFVAESCGTFCG